MVVIAIDYGEKKIGLAVGNTETMTSSPISIVKKAKTGFNWDELKEKIMEWEPNRIIIGKPLNMDGTRSDFMEKVERFAKKLRSIIDIEIEFFDERLTSFEARQLDEDSQMIDDVAAKNIAFGGRVIDPDDEPKYLNSPETKLFNKSNELYGLYEARKETKKMDLFIQYSIKATQEALLDANLEITEDRRRCRRFYCFV